jgi:hypothetical protein
MKIWGDRISKDEQLLPLEIELKIWEVKVYF